jgi:hypothetical protein
MLLRKADVDTNLSSVSDVGADTAMSVVVIRSFPSMYSRCDRYDSVSRAAPEQ